MGQKVHPGGLRVGVIHTWKSNWFTSKKEFAGALLEDVHIRDHIYGKLAHAGVRFCIADEGGGDGAANARNLPHHAAMAAAFGLDRDEALLAVTLYPARILGVGAQLGSIEVGKLADLQITDGDPLLVATHCEQVVLNGKLVPMESRQTRLFDKYDHRPRGAKARKR